MTLIEIWYNFRKTPYYELEYFIDENRRIGREFIPVTGQTTIQSKKYKGKAFYIPKSYNPDIIGYKRRVKFYVENMFPRVEPGVYSPSEDYEVLVGVPEQDENGNPVLNKHGEPVLIHLVARSDFYNKILETDMTGEILSEPKSRLEDLMPLFYIIAILAGIFILFGVVLPALGG